MDNLTLDLVKLDVFGIKFLLKLNFLVQTKHDTDLVRSAKRVCVRALCYEQICRKPFAAKFAYSQISSKFRLTELYLIAKIPKTLKEKVALPTISLINIKIKSTNFHRSRQAEF